MWLCNQITEPVLHPRAVTVRQRLRAAQKQVLVARTVPCFVNPNDVANDVALDNEGIRVVLCMYQSYTLD